jgi:hypothetical protein
LRFYSQSPIFLFCEKGGIIMPLNAAVSNIMKQMEQEGAI